MSTSAPPHIVAFLERINNGVELLDELYPGWIHEVTIEDLDLGEPKRCVLGQVARARGQDYDHAVRHIVNTGRAEHEFVAQVQYGFALPPLSFVNWGEATAMWRDAITALRAKRCMALILAA